MEHDYILRPEILEKKLRAADDNPYLNYDALVEACDKIFGNKKAVSYEEYKRLTEDSYKINMEDYAKLHNFTDSVKLAEYFAFVQTKIDQYIPLTARTDKIIVIGCGQGRLAEVYVTLAKKLGVKTITFNDLIESHVQQTKQKIKALYSTDGSSADGIKIEYLPGDFFTVDVSGYFDMAFLIWYVSSEFCNPSSVESLRKTRHQMYLKINSILIPGGGLVEDIVS